MLNVALGFRQAPTDALNNPLEIHHLLSGGRRRGHSETVCLCRWHHQGDKTLGDNVSLARQALIFGPSLAKEPRRFRELYGQDDELLTRQNQLVASTLTDASDHES